MPDDFTQTPEAEADALISTLSSFAECQRLITQQFDVIQARTQSLMGLAALALTITGFSGPKIAASNDFSRGAMILGLAFVLISVVVALTGALRIRWLTQIKRGSDAETLSEMIRYRDAKTVQYRRAMAALAVGLVCYIGSVIVYMLRGVE